MASHWIEFMTPLGPLRLEAEAAGLLAVVWLDRTGTEEPDPAPPSSVHLLLGRAQEAIYRYFESPCQRLPPVPLAPVVPATSFQRRVWHTLRCIPPGQPLTYGELARQLETAPQAIGTACAANPWPILLPCHRVVSRTGLGGYGGKAEGLGVEIKKQLLIHEGWEMPSAQRGG